MATPEGFWTATVRSTTAAVALDRAREKDETVLPGSPFAPAKETDFVKVTPSTSTRVPATDVLTLVTPSSSAVTTAELTMASPKSLKPCSDVTVTGAAKVR